MNQSNFGNLHSRLKDLKVEHRDLNTVIASLNHIGPKDQLQICRLKKRNHLVKDEIAKIQDELLPDIIA